MPPDDPPAREVAGLKSHETYQLENVDIYHVQPIYHLTEVDFINLKSSNPWRAKLATGFLGTFIGSSILLAGKGVDSLYNAPDKITFRDAIAKINGWEVWAVAIACICMLCAYGFAAIFTTPRERLLERIAKFFKDHPGSAEARKK